MTATQTAAIRPFSRHPIASIKEIALTSVPLMLAALSDTVMLLVDRLMIAHYDAFALSSVVLPGNIAAIFHFSTFAIAGVAVNYVGQAYGKGQNEQIASPIWQMIWFCLLLMPLFMWLGWYSGAWFYRSAIGLPVFHIIAGR